MKIDWRRKLASRKLWLAVTALVADIIIACGGTQSTAGQVTAIIMAGASVLGYIIGESIVDTSYKNVKNEPDDVGRQMSE